MSETDKTNFDSSKLDDTQVKDLQSFFLRRRIFDKYIQESKIDLFTCPGCGYPTLPERGCYDICEVCNWEDNNQDDPEADEIWGGPNYEISLTENRLRVGKELRDNSEGFYMASKENPEIVIEKIKVHQRNTTEFLNRMPLDADSDHPLYEVYRQMNKDLLIQLSRQ